MAAYKLSCRVVLRGGAFCNLRRIVGDGEMVYLLTPPRPEWRPGRCCGCSAPLSIRLTGGAPPRPRPRHPRCPLWLVGRVIFYISHFPHFSPFLSLSLTSPPPVTPVAPTQIKPESLVCGPSIKGVTHRQSPNSRRIDTSVNLIGHITGRGER